ncbi:MAG: hypothetical protein ACI9MR_002967 [Myxococcota bacterium]|jgi:hypothetical protein
MRRILMVFAALALGAGGCDVTAAGVNETLSFRFDTDDRVFPVAFSTPIAVGYRADVIVSNKNGANGAVTAASSSDSAIIGVVGTAGSRVTLSAAAAGTADLIVASGALMDRVGVEAGEVATYDLRYPGFFLVPEQPPVRLAQGGSARFGLTLKDAGGRLLIGYGAFPVVLSPSTAGVVDASDAVAHVTVRFSELGVADVTIEGDDALTVEVVAPSDITDLTFEGELDLLQDAPGVVGLRGALAGGERVVGLAGLVTVESLTESVCEVQASPVLGDGAYAVDAKEPGTCELLATLGDTTGTIALTVRAK